MYDLDQYRKWLDDRSVRPTFPEIYMQMAHVIAQRATCIRTNSKGERMRVGCVITSTDFGQVYAVGYNGNARGLPNQCDSDTPGSCGCCHGEENAVIHCRELTATPKLVFCTHLPCPMCCKRLIQLGGVERVYYHQDYRIRDGLAFLEAVGIAHEEF